jgi:hypothetical protein
MPYREVNTVDTTLPPLYCAKLQAAEAKLYAERRAAKFGSPEWHRIATLHASMRGRLNREAGCYRPLPQG